MTTTPQIPRVEYREYKIPAIQDLSVPAHIPPHVYPHENKSSHVFTVSAYTQDIWNTNNETPVYSSKCDAKRNSGRGSEGGHAAQKER